MHRFLFLIGVLMWLGSMQSVQAAEWESRTFTVGEAEIPLFELNPKNAKAQVLWLPSEYGVLPQERKIAEQLAANALAVTLLDPYEALFLSPTPSAFEEIPSVWIEALIEKLHQEQKPLWIIAPNKAGVLALKALEAYQHQQSRQNMGLVLINPNLYIHTPEPGKSADYWPQVENANLPVSVLQAELSPWRWHLSGLQQKLAEQGSNVFIQLLPKLRDRFYFRPDAMPREVKAAKLLAGQIRQAMRWQIPYLQQTRLLSSLSSEVEVKQTRSLELKPYRGKQGLGFDLLDNRGNSHRLDDYLGKVVLVNFWASWCPPCVHEMPSMAKLKEQLGAEGFEILAVNLGEPKSEIERFSDQHSLNFPLLIDESGGAVKEWKVFAYPSSYIIDKKGKIRYALFGGTDWQEKHHMIKLRELLSE